MSQRAKVSLPPLLFQMFSNSDCYTNKDKSKSSTIISQKILTIGKWLETVWTETNVDEFDYFFLTQYPSYSCQKLPWKFFSKKSNRYFAWKFSSIAMLSKEKYCTGMTRRFTVAGFCWAALYGPCCKCCFGRRPVKKVCCSKTVKHRKRKAAVAAGAEPAKTTLTAGSVSYEANQQIFSSADWWVYLQIIQARQIRTRDSNLFWTFEKAIAAKLTWPSVSY